MRLNDALIGALLLAFATAMFLYARTLPAIPGLPAIPPLPALPSPPSLPGCPLD